ncbi:DUF2341 domain-containing protein [Hankyongella ginsenosidimutans]|uniref:DUF2341 domain-containing protein n=1 Tax=Hankyongella ginsenosidimutans TaxID=1763828 RepID=A0A4D7C257_9SPHN|nr:DUF2341 domain-containing protein [Hankyongella ginsenosidimutans]QCI79141.1 DUF2341 domain-containing protein [Hankyongella ginsenosidimutans]
MKFSMCRGRRAPAAGFWAAGADLPSGAVVPGAAQAWWNKDWAFRQQVILDATASGVPLQGNLNEVPVVVRLHTGNFSFAALRDDGADLRFIAQDDVTPLTFHVERFDWVSELAIVRVMVPALSAGEKLPVWVYYGNPEATPASDKKLCRTSRPFWRWTSSA